MLHVSWFALLLTAVTGHTDLNLGTCTGLWTTWLDRDNWTGTGDWEHLPAFRRSGQVPCSTPVAVQGRVKGTTVLETDQNVHFNIVGGYGGGGLVCKNNENIGNCQDYEVRFCCPRQTLTDGNCPVHQYWTGWLDRDNPSGTGDWEHLSAHVPNMTPPFNQVCRRPPAAAQARIKGSSSFTTNEVVTFSRTQGLICKNADQPDGSCSDYEIRFCCVYPIEQDLRDVRKLKSFDEMP